MSEIALRWGRWGGEGAAVDSGGCHNVFGGALAVYPGSWARWGAGGRYSSDCSSASVLVELRGPFAGTIRRPAQWYRRNHPLDFFEHLSLRNGPSARSPNARLRSRMSMHGEAALEAQLIGLAFKSTTFMTALQAARGLKLRSWCIGAGAVRNLVWDHLHGFATETPAQDIDLVFFDESNVSAEVERALNQTLTRAAPRFQWEAINQARVHLWATPRGCEAGPPFRSLADGIASWPEVATCVGLTLADEGISKSSRHTAWPSCSTWSFAGIPVAFQGQSSLKELPKSALLSDGLRSGCWSRLRMPHRRPVAQCRPGPAEAALHFKVPLQ